MEEIELIEKRKPREKHFLQKDGTIVAKIYDTDVHFLKDGKYEEIDNTLVKKGNLYVNKSNDYNVEFENILNNYLMKMKKDDNYLNIRLSNCNHSRIITEESASKLEQSVLYENVIDDISIQYKTLPNKVKETIVLKSNKYSRLNFIAETNLDLIMEDKCIIATKNGDKVFELEAPYMEDSEGKINNNIYYYLINHGDHYDIELNLDSNWLNSLDVKFPVYVDPTISNENNNLNIYDTYIYPGDTNDSRYNKSYLKAGVEKVNGSNRINRTLIKFDLPKIGTGDEIINASLDLISYPTYSTEPKYNVATFHRITSDWNESSANWDSMHDKYDSHVESMFYGTRSIINNESISPSYSIYEGNITNLVKEWYKDTPNYGIMIKSLKEDYDDDDYPMFYSNNNTYIDNNPKPIFQLVYRNQNGLEDYLNYKKQEFTDGSSFVNTYNGNLTTVFNLGGTVGGNLPVTVDLIYNTNDVILENNSKFGLGYKLNLNQTIQEDTKENINYLVYLDEDGTTHYFSKDNVSDVYTDEDNLGLTISKNEIECIMKDEDGNIMTFTNIDNIYYLTKIEDIDNNTINITLNNDKSISSITDAFNNLVSFTYDTNSIVITSPDSVTTLNYEDDNLTKITTPNGVTRFIYNNNHLIEKIIDATEIKLEYSYYSNSPYKLKKITQYSVENEIGEFFTLDYGFETTTITDNKNRCETLIFNNYGNLLSTSSLTSESDIDNAYSISNTFGDDTSNKNRILSSTTPTKIIKNLLKNTSFENEANYFTSSDNLTSTFSNEFANFGNRSLKLHSSNNNEYIYQNVEIAKNQFYTYSAYFKSNVNYKISLSYIDENNVEKIVEDSFSPCENFERNDLSIFYPSSSLSNLTIKILLVDSGIVYMDDIQLETGTVANSYNFIENNDFSDGFNEWNTRAITFDDSTVNCNDYISKISFNEEKNTALKITGYPLYTFLLEKELSIKGKKGDLYSFAFWYKNNGIPGYGPVAGTKVMIYFKPVGTEAEYCIPVSDNLNVNKNKWQYYSYSSHAIEDYESIRLVITVGRVANDFYITNLSFNKEITMGEYSYDEAGNLISISDQSNNCNIFNYDDKNNLIKMTNTLGNSYVYEYDKNKKSRIINAISSNGISNRIYFDSYGNPKKTKISKRYVDEITDGLYKIRCAGTNKYLKAEYMWVLSEESECSNTIWKLVKDGDDYKIIYNSVDTYYLACNENKIFLSLSDDNNIFRLEKNENGSYYIKYIENGIEGSTVKFLSANDDNTIETLPFVEENSNIEFYIEKLDDLFYENNAIYSSDNQFVNSVTDSSLKTFVYNTNNVNGLLTSSIDPQNNKTFYTYDNKKHLIEVKKNNRKIIFDYNDKNLLSKIIQNNKNYNITYNNFLNIDSIKLNDTKLASYEYANKNGNLIKTIYGNNQTIKIDYDYFDRLDKIIKMDDIFGYHYDNNGNVAKIISNNSVKKIYYDKSNRLCKFKENDFSIDYFYNSENKITNCNYKLNNILHTYNNVFDNSERIISTKLDDTVVNYHYDELDRNISKNINNLINYQFKYLSNGKRTTDIVKEYVINNDSYKYKYDNLFNIKDIYLNDTLIKHYDYDEYGELLSEVNYDLNTKYNYSYDLSGNMLKKSIINNSTNEIIKEYSYTYSNLNWEDQLTSFDNKEITYDNIGNVVNYDNKNFSWINGIELASYTDNINNKIINYKYNENGIRISKCSTDISSNYYLSGDDIIYETRNGNNIYYLYDADELIGFEYQNNKYLYLKNLHDDIIGIINSTGKIIVKYEYDSWGNILSIKDSNNQNISETDYNHIANINPFRYRSYYYDVETKLYYLKSRYYNPLWGRFINADGMIGANEDFLAYNLYLYVSNNPINNYDDDGHKKKTTKKKKKKKSNNILKIGIGLGLAVVGVAAIVVSGGSLAPAVVGAAKIIGVTVGVSVGLQVAKNIVSSVSSGGGTKEVKKNVFNNVGSAAANGVLAGGATVAIMGGLNTYLKDYAGYGFGNKETIEGMYSTPKTEGGTIISIKKLDRFRLDLDRVHGLHFHVGKTKSQREVHRVIINWVFGKK